MSTGLRHETRHEASKHIRQEDLLVDTRSPQDTTNGMSVKPQIQDNSEKAYQPVAKEGWLHKEGGAARSKWQSRWFSLRGDQLSYYSRKEDTANPLGSLNLSEAVDISKIGEHSGKRHCLTVVATKGNTKKVYYLAADSEESLNDWFAAMKAAVTDSDNRQLCRTKYATAEVFLNSGIRINGDVSYNILASLSQRVGPEKKRRDSLGWFCEQEVPLAMVLNLFAQYGWNAEKIYRSSALLTVDSGIHPVIRVIFSKKPLQPGSCSTSSAESSRGGTPSIARRGLDSFKDYMSRFISEPGQMDSAASTSAGSNVKPTAVATTADLGDVLEGADDELAGLMQEFDIPLSLLQLHSE